MAAEVPIIATAAGGVPDMLSPAEALLVPSEQPAAIAGAIAEVWADRRSAAARACTAAAHLATAFQLDPWVRRYEAIYERIMAARARDSAWL